MCCIGKYEKKWAELDALISDSAKYMIKSEREIKVSFCLSLLIVRCWAHIFNLVVQEISEYKIFNTIHFLNSNLQKLFEHNTRKCRYLTFLKENNFQPQVMLTVVLSRWGIWFQGADYLFSYIDLIYLYLKKEDKEEDKSKLVEKCLEAIEIESLPKLQIVLSFLHEQLNKK